MRPNVQQKPAVGIFLLWTLSCVAQSSGQEHCKPFPLNQTLSYTDLQAMQEKLSACCWTAPNNCQVAGGFCIPAWLGRFCPQTNDVLCGRCGCTCCMEKIIPVIRQCSGSCSRPYQRCMPERECFMRKMDADVGDLVPIDSCGSPGCACCPIFAY
ncbi:uncharacterized protein LOC125045347 [Penaeus chinensis]|uniref:uncharacterized protein LOC125045347 n=1 Tax=Penaeus chinensis TaxID=139456 RepID=UPI001FB6B81E|nr:uncharacterized protein LOC125045347 [Penaeus chinensis]